MLLILAGCDRPHRQQWYVAYSLQ